MLQPVFSRRHSIPFFELTVKIALVLISYSYRNLFNRKIKFYQQHDCLLESLALQQLLKCKSCGLFNHFTQHRERLVKIFCDFRQRCRLILGIDVR